MDVLKRMQRLALFQGVPAEKLKALAERALSTEMDVHLDQERRARA